MGSGEDATGTLMAGWPEALASGVNETNPTRRSISALQSTAGDRYPSLGVVAATTGVSSVSIPCASKARLTRAALARNRAITAGVAMERRQNRRARLRVKPSVWDASKPRPNDSLPACCAANASIDQ